MRIRFCFLILLLFCSLSFSETNHYVKLAVLDINSRTKIDKIDRNFLTERLQIELVNYDGIKVVERLQLKKIMDEQKMQLSGITEKDAVKIGSISGADKIVVGSLTEVDGKYILIIKVIDTSTSEIDFIDQVSGDNTSELSEKLVFLSSKIVKVLLKKDVQVKYERKDEVKKDEGLKQKEKAKININSSEKFWTPIAFSFVTPIQLPSEDYTIYGGVFSLIYTRYSKVYGIFWGGLILEADKVYGFQGGHYAIVNMNNYLYGAQAGLINISHERTFGVQAGLFNQAENITGVQVGLVNIARKMVGVQIGLVNIIHTGFVPFMLGINISF